MKTEPYKLFIGFRKLGKFQTIHETKLFAQRCGEGGIFSLIGNNYNDSWYMSNKDLKIEQ